MRKPLLLAAVMLVAVAGCAAPSASRSSLGKVVSSTAHPAGGPTPGATGGPTRGATGGPATSAPTHPSSTPTTRPGNTGGGAPSATSGGSGSGTGVWTPSPSTPVHYSTPDYSIQLVGD